MKKIFLITVAVFMAAAVSAQITIADSATFFLHKFAQNIGKETYHISRQGNDLVFDINFKFVDRSAPVVLKAKLVTNSNTDPVSLFIKGSTSRVSTINDSIYINDGKVKIIADDSSYTKQLKPSSFTVAGYSPGTVQMMLLQYWKKHKMPASINLLPEGKVSIRKTGNDTLMLNGTPVHLDRYIISGIIWGNEILWTDAAGNLVCLITNDAEGDKLEMVQEAYESLLPVMLAKAADIGMQLFSASMNVKWNEKNILAVTGGNVIDVETGAVIKDATIIVENGIIKKISSGKAEIPANATIIDARGKIILPGLWDMHAHFQQAEWGPAYLAAGVTTVRDCGNEFVYINAVKSAIDAGKGIGPDILKAGIIDGSGTMALGIVHASTPEEAAAAVQMYKNNGFVQIKIYSSVKPAIVKAICDEAHKLGLTVTGHIPNGMKLMAAIDSGMDQVNHIQYFSSAMKKNKDRLPDLNDSSNIALLDIIKARNIVADPTIGVFEMVFRSLKDDIRNIEPAFYSLPLPLQLLFKNTGMPEKQAAMYKTSFDGMKIAVKALHDKGITIMAGTDMGFPGLSLFRELELYTEIGLTPLEAIQSASIVPARVMKMNAQTGSLKEGKQADLIIVDGNPLQRISDIRKIQTVIRKGRVYDPVALRKMVGFLN